MTEVRRYGWRSLRFKFVFASVLVEALMLSLLIWNSARITDDALAEVFQSRVETLVPLMNTNLATPLAQRDYASLDERLQRMVRADSLIYLEVRNELGQIAASRGPVPTATQIDLSFKKSNQIYNQAFDITLGGRVIGRARYGLNVSLLQATLASLRNQGALVATIEIVLSILLLASLGALLTRHLQILTQAALTFAGGDHSVRVPTTGRDEVSDTARAFNNMAETIEHDIRERRRVEMALRASEHRFISLVGNLPGFVYRCRNDRDWTVEYISENCHAITGHRPQEFLDNVVTFGQLIHPDDQQHVWDEVQNGIQARRSYQITYRIYTARHEERTVLEQGAAIFSDTGDVEALEGFISDVTDLTHTQEALRESEERLRLALDAAHMGTFDWDIDNNHITWSRWHEELWGFRPGEFGGTYESFSQRVHPNDLLDIEAKLNRCMTARSAFAHEFRVIWPDGSAHWIAGRGEFVFDSEGRPIRMRGAVVDITGQKQTETALRASEGHFRTIFEQATDGILVSDIKGRLLDANSASCQMLGYTRDELLKLNNADIVVADEVARIRPETNRILGGDIVHSEWRVRRKDGSVRLVEVSAKQLPNGHLQAFLRDITERTQAAEQMQKLSSAIEQTADSVMITNREGIIEYVNPAFEITTGYQSADALGRKPNIVKSGLQDATFYEELWAKILNGESFRGVFVNRRKDGSLYHEEKTITPLRDSGQRITHFVSTGKDISERIHAESSVRASEEHLRTIIDTEPECIKLLAEDGSLIDMNAAGLAMIEADSLEQVLGTAMQELVMPEHHEAFQELSRNVFRGHKGMLTFEIEGLKGARRWLETHAVPMTSRTGKTVLLGITRDITERKTAEERLSYLVHHDELTGLPNRTLFNDRLNQAMIDAERHGRLVALAFLDLDRFKNINDTLGHEAGDLLLQGVAERLLHAVRRGDTVARLSGDEFTIVLADLAHADDAARVAQKILDALAKPLPIAGRDLFISASLGLTLYPLDSRDSQELLRNADIAMYRAKEQGRNNFQFYTSEMTSKAVERMGIETALRRALDNDEFTLHYQPIVDGRDGRVIAVEALIRWQNGGKGMISPMQFIPVAEETGLIIPIGEWVLRTACAQLASWHAAGLPKLRMSVNLSVRQFRNLNLVAMVGRALATSALDPADLELEITESIMVEEQMVIDTLRELDALGVHFSIDDFGTGYSSLSYLKRLPIDTLKIDRSFVTDIPDNADDAAIAQAIIALAQSLGMRVVAEGVESLEQNRFLQRNGCDAMQGYYFSKPLPAAELAVILKKHKALPFK